MDEFLWMIDELVKSLLPNVEEVTEVDDSAKRLGTVLKSALGGITFPNSAWLGKISLPDENVSQVHFLRMAQEENFCGLSTEALNGFEAKRKGEPLPTQVDLCTNIFEDDVLRNFVISKITTLTDKNRVALEVNGVGFELAVNDLRGLLLVSAFAEIDQLIGKNHLLKRSLLLIKAWCAYESHRFGLNSLTEIFSTDALIVMTLCLFCSHEEGTIDHPLSALLLFLREYSNTSAYDFAVTATHLQPLMTILQSKATSSHPLDPNFDRHSYGSASSSKDVEYEDRHHYPLRHEVLKILWKNSRRYHSIYYSTKGVHTAETMGGVKPTPNEGNSSILGLIHRKSAFYGLQNAEQWERSNRLIVLDPIDGKTNLCYYPIGLTCKFPRLKSFLGTTPNLQKLFESGLQQLSYAVSRVQSLSKSLSERKTHSKDRNDYLLNVNGRGENSEANGSASGLGESETGKSDPSGVTSELGNSAHVSDSSDSDGSHSPVEDVRALFQASFKKTIELVDLKSLSRSSTCHISFLTKLESFNLHEIECTFTEQDSNGKVDENRQTHVSDSMGSYQHELSKNVCAGETFTDVSRNLSKWSDRRQNRAVLFTALSISLADIEACIRQAETILSPEIPLETVTVLITQVLNKNGGSMAIGEIGKQLQAVTGDADVLRSLRKIGLGLKRFIKSQPETFDIGLDHPLNPVISIHRIGNSTSSASQHEAQEEMTLDSSLPSLQEGSSQYSTVEPWSMGGIVGDLNAQNLCWRTEEEQVAQRYFNRMPIPYQEPSVPQQMNFVSQHQNRSTGNNRVFDKYHSHVSDQRDFYHDQTQRMKTYPSKKGVNSPYFPDPLERQYNAQASNYFAGGYNQSQYGEIDGKYASIKQRADQWNYNPSMDGGRRNPPYSRQYY